MEKTIPRKIHDIGKKNEWTNSHAMLARAIERVDPSTRVMVCWFDEETKQIVYMQKCNDIDAHYMCHRIAGAL